MAPQYRDQEVHDTAGDGQEVVQRVSREGDGVEVERRKPVELLDGPLQIGLCLGDRGRDPPLGVERPSLHAHANPLAFYRAEQGRPIGPSSDVRGRGLLRRRVAETKVP